MKKKIFIIFIVFILISGYLFFGFNPTKYVFKNTFKVKKLSNSQIGLVVKSGGDMFAEIMDYNISDEITKYKVVLEKFENGTFIKEDTMFENEVSKKGFISVFSRIRDNKYIIFGLKDNLGISYGEHISKSERDIKIIYTSNLGTSEKFKDTYKIEKGKEFYLYTVATYADSMTGPNLQFDYNSDGKNSEIVKDSTEFYAVKIIFS